MKNILGNSGVCFSILIAMLIASLPALADKNKDVEIKWEVGMRANYLDAGDYYQINTTKITSESGKAQWGIDAGMLLPLPFVLPQLQLGLAFSHTATYSSDVQAFCNSNLCEKKTSLGFDALQANAHYQFYRNDTAEIGAYAGLSHVWVQGEVKGDSWSNGALGGQVGAKVHFMPTSQFQPYVGLQWMQFEAESDDTIKLSNWSLLAGVRF